MDSDWLFIGAVIVIMLYMTGYRAYAMVAGLLIAVIFVFSAIFERQPQKAGSSSNVLEPIVIESTRGLAYRIPGELNIQYDRKMKEGAQWEKTQKKWGTAFGQLVRKARGQKQKEE